MCFDNITAFNIVLTYIHEPICCIDTDKPEGKFPIENAALNFS